MELLSSSFSISRAAAADVVTAAVFSSTTVFAWAITFVLVIKGTATTTAMV